MESLRDSRTSQILLKFSLMRSIYVVDYKEDEIDNRTTTQYSIHLWRRKMRGTEYYERLNLDLRIVNEFGIVVKSDLEDSKARLGKLDVPLEPL